MGFERARIEIKPASTGTGIKVSIAKIRGGASRMRFSVNSTLAKKFDWAGGDKLEVMIGTGEHHGLIRVRKNNSVGDAEVVTKTGPHASKYVQISLGHQPAFVDRAESARWCQFEEVDDGFIEIVLPKWADETSPRRATSVALTPPARSPQAPESQARRQNVTSAILGDPAPNRKQVLRQMGDMKI